LQADPRQELAEFYRNSFSHPALTIRKCIGNYNIKLYNILIDNNSPSGKIGWFMSHYDCSRTARRMEIFLGRVHSSAASENVDVKFECNKILYE